MFELKEFVGYTAEVPNKKDEKIVESEEESTTEEE